MSVAPRFADLKAEGSSPLGHATLLNTKRHPVSLPQGRSSARRWGVLDVALDLGAEGLLLFAVADGRHAEVGLDHDLLHAGTVSTSRLVDESRVLDRPPSGDSQTPRKQKRFILTPNWR